MMRQQDIGLIGGAAGVILLVASWWWFFRRKRSLAGWRAKSAQASFVCATIAAGLGLILAVLVRVAGGPELYFRALVAMGLISVAGVVSGLAGKGSPRLMGIVWSLIMLTACYFIFGTSGH